MVEGRLRRGLLERIHPGVYCVAGAPRTFEQRAFAAAAWGGRSAVVSHSSAAHLWRMTEHAPTVREISCRQKRTRPPEGVRAHFASDLPVRDCGKLRNIPVTSPVRTLIDLAGVLAVHEVELALHQAIVDRRVTARSLRARLHETPHRGARGPALLRRLLSDGCRRAPSPLEQEVARVLRGAGLPPVRREHPVYLDGGVYYGGVYYLDFAWPHFRVGVEADSRRWHSDVQSFEHDRVRHNALLAAGWSVVRVTQQQVRSDPGVIREQVLRLLVEG